MAILGKIAAAVTNVCTSVPAKGLCVKGWIINRGDVVWTGGDGTPLITAGACAVGKKAW